MPLPLAPGGTAASTRSIAVRSRNQRRRCAASPRSAPSSTSRSRIPREECHHRFRGGPGDGPGPGIVRSIGAELRFLHVQPRFDGRPVSVLRGNADHLVLRRGPLRLSRRWPSATSIAAAIRKNVRRRFLDPGERLRCVPVAVSASPHARVQARGAGLASYCCHTVRLELPLLWNPSVAMIWYAWLPRFHPLPAHAFTWFWNVIVWLLPVERLDLRTLQY